MNEKKKKEKEAEKIIIGKRVCYKGMCLFQLILCYVCSLYNTCIDTYKYTHTLLTYYAINASADIIFALVPSKRRFFVVAFFVGLEKQNDY